MVFWAILVLRDACVRTIFPGAAVIDKLISLDTLALKLTIGRYAIMAKPQRKIKKANHGKRPASSKARRLKRGIVRT